MTGSTLLKACLKLINTIEDRYKLKYVWLSDIAEKKCTEIHKEIKLCNFLMLCTGNIWYTKYGFIPFSTTDGTINEYKYEHFLYNKHILENTKVECTNVIDHILSAITKNKKNHKANTGDIKNILKKYNKKSIVEIMAFFFDDFDNKCFLFNDIYSNVSIELKLHDLFEFKYFLKLKYYTPIHI
jgi:hypothetical protein